MRKSLWLIIPAVVLLASCKTMPVTATFPEATPSLMEKCKALELADPNDPKLTALLTTVTKNYQSSASCSDKVDKWIEWYNTQSKIFNKATK